MVTTVLGEVAGSSPRTSFESAVADGDCAIASSQYAADRAAEIFPAALTRLRIVRPGLDLAKLAPEAVSRQRVAKAREGWGAAPHERVVLAPARLQPERGPKLVIEAASLIKARGLQDIRFVLAGEPAKPAFARELDALAAARGVKSIVAQVGAPADRPAAFVAASLVVFPANEAGRGHAHDHRGGRDGRIDRRLRCRAGARDHRRAAARGSRGALGLAHSAWRRSGSGGGDRGGAHASAPRRERRSGSGRARASPGSIRSSE